MIKLYKYDKKRIKTENFYIKLKETTSKPLTKLTLKALT